MSTKNNRCPRQGLIFKIKTSRIKGKIRFDKIKKIIGTKDGHF